MTDGGLSPEVRAWLAGAGNRLNEPVREDPREIVQARIDALTALPPITLPAHPEGEYVALEVALREEVGDEDGALSVVQVALAAGWRPPGGIAALVAAARTETAERIAAAIEAARNGGRRIEPYSNHYNAGVTEAARIARETR